MLLLVRYKDRDAAIVGYAPGPLAILVCDGQLMHAELGELEVLNVPKKLQRLQHKRRKANGHASTHDMTTEHPGGHG